MNNAKPNPAAFRIFSLFISITFLPILLSGKEQEIQEESSVVRFEVKNMGVNTVDGTFMGMHGTVEFNPADLENSTFSVCIDASTVDTDNNQRDKHLRAKAFFHIEEYPEICFESTDIYPKGNGYEVQGKLTMRGTTRIVTIPFEYSSNSLTGSFTLNRKDYDVGNGYANFVISNDVDIRIECVLK